MAFGFVACRRGAPVPASTSSEPALVSAPASQGARRSRLPEDPVKARKATAQWQEHLREEERERRHRFDRFRLKQHETVLSALEKARVRYDVAKTQAAIESAKSAFRAKLPALKELVLAIDPDRNSSDLVDDYEAILGNLEGPYPEARIEALAGDAKRFTELGNDVDRRIAAARAWLAIEDLEAQERAMKQKR
jgi:hypothetical protein